MNQNRILENTSMQIKWYDWQEVKQKWSHTWNISYMFSDIILWHIHIMDHTEFPWYCPVSSPSLVSPWHIHQVQPPWHILVPRTRHLWWCSDLHQWAWPWDLRYLPDTSLYPGPLHTVSKFWSFSNQNESVLNFVTSGILWTILLCLHNVLMFCWSLIY